MRTNARRPRPRTWHGVHRLLTLAAVAALVILAGCSSTPRASAPKTPTPTPTATLTPDQLRAQQIAASTQYYLSRMSLDQKLGQMMLIETGYTTYTRDVDNMVRGMHAGAMIIYKQNMAVGNPNGPALLKSYIATVQSHADLPMIVSMDEEGGGVDRLGEYGFDPPLPSPEATAKTGNPQNAQNAGATAAKEMLPLGINTNLAPLADVLLTNNPSILWTRMYGTSVTTVDQYGGEFLQGTQDNGVIATVKHWPGAGDITVDPHLGLPVTRRTTDQLESTEFASFRAMLALNPGMVMVTHILVPAIDQKLPATLSPALVQGTLRDQLGYQGVVMTDSLYMKAISDSYNLGQAAVLSVEAGDDLLEGAYDTASMSFMINSLKGAISAGQITQARIDQSVSRILALKLRFGILPLHVAPVTTPSASPSATFKAPPSAAIPGLLPQQGWTTIVAARRHFAWSPGAVFRLLGLPPPS